MEGHEYLSHLSLLRRHGPQLMVFLARLAGTLTRSVLEEPSRDAGDRGRVPVEGVSASEVSLGERSNSLDDKGGISGVAGGGESEGERKVSKFVE
jgi:hypothetical protein